MARRLTLGACLDRMVSAGRMSRAQAAETIRVAEQFERENLGRMGPDAARAAAEAQAAARFKADAAKRLDQASLQILATDRVLRDAASHPKGWFAGAASLLARDVWGVAGFSGVERRYKAVLGQLHAMFADGLNAYRSKMAGLQRDTIGLQRMVRELYGESTGDGVAANAAQAWTGATDWAAKRFNDAGGILARQEDWRLPQVFDDAKVKAAGRDSFTGWMTQALDDGRLSVVDWTTGRPMERARAVEIIEGAWERISTGGLSDMVPGQRAGSKLANARIERRAFDWTTADAWLEANRQWGVGDSQVYDLLTGHLDGIARDIAQLEVLGPNPAATVSLLRDHVLKETGSRWKADRIDALWAHVSGAASSPVSEGLANFMRSVRSWLTSAQLGSAVLSSFTDFAALRQTAAWNGLDATKVMGTYLRMLNPASAEDRALAVRAGLIADSWAQRAAGATRHQAEVVGNDLASRFAEFTMRASGLQAHTDAGRHAFGMEMLAHLADLAGQGFDALPPATRRAFENYGISAADWELIRATGVRDFGSGARFVWPEQMARAGRNEMLAASRLMEMVSTEMDFAIPTPGAYERALLLGNTRPGTAQGEFLRATLQYKTFPVTMMTTHLMRAYQGLEGGDRGAYLAALGIGLTVMGALAMQAKQIAAGKDPRDMTDWRFWGGAFAQGGGAGIFGDFLNSGLNRADRGVWATMAGPTAGLVDDLARLTLGNIGQSTDPNVRDNHLGREVARFVRQNTPGSSLWYSRLALDRLVWDRLQMAIDSDYPAAFRRTEDRAMRDYRQSFFWGPGDAAPARAPSLGATLGGSR